MVFTSNTQLYYFSLSTCNSIIAEWIESNKAVQIVEKAVSRNSGSQSLFPARHYQCAPTSDITSLENCKIHAVHTCQICKWCTCNRINSCLKIHLTDTFVWFDYFLTFTAVFMKNFVKLLPIGPPNVIILQARTIFYRPKIISSNFIWSAFWMKKKTPCPLQADTCISLDTCMFYCMENWY
jgi:hypothetical protein